MSTKTVEEAPCELFLTTHTVNTNCLSDLGAALQKIQVEVLRRKAMLTPLGWYAEERKDKKGYDIGIFIGGRQMKSVKFNIILSAPPGEQYQRNNSQVTFDQIVDAIVYAESF